MDWSVLSGNARIAAAALAALVLVVILLLVLWRRARRSLPYARRTALLSAAERNLLVALHHAVGPGVEVWPRVGAADVLDVRRGTGRGRTRRARRRIAGTRIDFLLCTAADTCPLLVVQCGEQARDKRERRLEGACAAAGLALVRVPPREDYDAGALREELRPHLEPPAESAAAEGGLAGRQEPIIDLPPD